MNADKERFGRTIRWTWAGVAAVLFHIALYWGVFWTQGSDQKLRRQSRQFTEIQYFDTEATDRSELLSQQMTLFDPRPLLLPTRWNAANASGSSDFLQEEAEIFPEFPPMFELEDGSYVDDFGNTVASYDSLSAAQVDFAYPIFDGLGRKEPKELDPLEEGLALTISGTAGGGELATAIVSSEEVAQLAVEWPEWKPVTFLATVENSFPVGGFSLLESSGFEEVDMRLRRIARAYFPDLKQLEDGVYLLEIVP